MKVIIILFTLFPVLAHECLPQRTNLDINEVINTARMVQRLSGDHVGNGGGLSESNFAFARQNLKSLISNCLSSNLCLSNEKERSLTKRVYEILDEELMHSSQLKYLSGSDNPRFFFLDGNIRVAKTGDSVGDVIYINRDMIYDDQGRALELSKAVAILFHEYGHHIGIRDHDYLDMVGAKIGLFVSKESFVLATKYSDVKLPIVKKKALVVKSLGIATGKERLIFSGTNENVDLTNLVLNKIRSNVELACMDKVELCSIFLGVNERGYVPSIYYFQNARIEKYITSRIDRDSYYLNVYVTSLTQSDVSKGLSSFYHLKSDVHFRVKVKRADTAILGIEILSVSSRKHFGIEF